jgi:hypothetical protein
MLLFLGLPGATFAATIQVIEAVAVTLSAGGGSESRVLSIPDGDGDGIPDDAGDVIALGLLKFAVFNARAGFTVQGKYDPYLAAAGRIQNTSTAPVFFGLDITSLMEPFRPGEGTGSLERFLRFTLTDANQNGAASFGPANIFFSVQERSSGTGAQAGGFLTASLAAPGVLTRLDGTEAPLNVFLPSSVQQFDGLRFQLSGTLSAGDELLIEVFSCFRKGAQTCPPRPLLEAPAVPVPGAAVLLATALGGLAPWLRRARGRA